MEHTLSAFQYDIILLLSLVLTKTVWKNNLIYHFNILAFLLIIQFSKSFSFLEYINILSKQYLQSSEI